ncbi:MAG TPA: condensation domain-containing protein, partial [Herpetosiphonaceae bacterium]
GKVDRKALPAPEADTLTVEDEYASRTPTEEILAGLWAALLHRSHIGLHDNFFTIGGHSLLATQLLSRIRATFQVELPLRQLFETPTLAALARQIADAAPDAGADAPPPLERASREQALPLSFAQQRLWFLDQLEPGSRAYAMPIALRLHGPLDRAALQHSLDALVVRHESLRTTFPMTLGQPTQVIADPQPVPLPIIQLAHGPDAEREAELFRLIAEDTSRPFVLATGPLLRATLFGMDAETHVLLLNLHHIIADGWSMQVLLRELVQLYRAAAQGEAVTLPELPIQYADYALWQRQWLQGAVRARQLGYWQHQLADLAPLHLPTDHPRPAVPSLRGATHAFALAPTLSAAVVHLSRREGATLFMTLLAAWQVLLSRYSGQDDIVVGTPIAGRTRGETEDLI